MKLLGSVSKGAQVGALAMTAEGAYVQVVGDYLVPLKTKEIAKAVANAPKEPNLVLSNEIQSWQASRKKVSAQRTHLDHSAAAVAENQRA